MVLMFFSGLVIYLFNSCFAFLYFIRSRGKLPCIFLFDFFYEERKFFSGLCSTFLSRAILPLQYASMGYNCSATLRPSTTKNPTIPPSTESTP